MADTIDATGPQSVGGNPEAEGAEAVEIAQAGPTADAEPIGQVDSFEGTVTVTHADGTQEVLEAGSSVFQGDTLETGDGGAVGITLADETTFSMAENGSMVLDEMVYDPGTQEGSVSVSVLEGVFTFVSGQIAKTDPDAMTLDTPVATIGIRGTQVGLDIGEGGEMTVVLMEEKDGFVGEVVVTNDAGVVVMNSANQATSVLSLDQPPSETFVMDTSQLVQTFGDALRQLTTEGNSANSYELEDAEAGDEEEAGEEELKRSWPKRNWRKRSSSSRKNWPRRWTKKERSRKSWPSAISTISRIWRTLKRLPVVTRKSWRSRRTKSSTTRAPRNSAILRIWRTSKRPPAAGRTWATATCHRHRHRTYRRLPTSIY